MNQIQAFTARKPNQIWRKLRQIAAGNNQLSKAKQLDLKNHGNVRYVRHTGGKAIHRFTVFINVASSIQGVRIRQLKDLIGIRLKYLFARSRWLRGLLVSLPLQRRGREVQTTMRLEPA